MTSTARIIVTLAVFATMLARVVVRPRRWNEAWWTMLGALAAALRTSDSASLINARRPGRIYFYKRIRHREGYLSG